MQHLKCMFGKNDFERLPFSEKNPSQLPIAVKEQMFPLAQRLAFVNDVLNICSQNFGETAHSGACHMQGSEASTLQVDP